MSRISNLAKLARDKSGATLIYVTLIIAVLVGMAGLAVDISRFYATDTQAQAAADAAALAAAAQLDGSVDSITRAKAAAENASPLIVNSQDFADEGAGSAAGVQLTLRFLSGLPPSDDTPVDAFVTTDPKLAQFVEATTETLTHNNVLLPALKIAKTQTLNATAIAGQESTFCRRVPFAICNPGETVGGKENFDFSAFVGTQVLVKQVGPNSAWAPGNFGYLDPPSGLNGAKAIAEYLATVDRADQCFGTGLNTRPGQINSARNALNTRFDIYEQPHFGQNAKRDDRFPPAANVTKGFTPSAGGNGNGNGNGNGGGNNNACDAAVDPADTTVMGLPRDNGGSDGSAVGSRFGNGNWDCADYWAANHPDDPGMAGLAGDGYSCSNNSSAMSRYQMYRWEIDNNKIPGAATGGPEEGTPGCYEGTEFPDNEETDRRAVHFAVMNCIAENVRGNTDGVPSIAFIRAFLTEPIDGVNFDVYLEVVDGHQVGTNDGPLQETVEIFR